MPEELVAVKTCSSALEASFIKSYLENHGVRAWNTGDKQRGWTGRYSMIARGARVMVMPKDADQARALLENPEAFLEEEGAVEDTPEGTHQEAWTQDDAGNLLCCPNCGSTNIEEIATSPLVRILVAVMLLGLPLFLGRKQTWMCRDCDWDSNRQ